MNAKQLFAAVATIAVVGFSGSVAFANEADFAPQAVSTQSRAAVKAELAQAIAGKTLRTYGEYASLEVTQPQSSGLTRQEVRAQSSDYVRSGNAYQDRLQSSGLGN